MKKNTTTIYSFIPLAFFITSFFITSFFAMLFFTAALLAGETREFVLENDSLKRIISTTDGQKLQTTEIVNKLNNIAVKPTAAPEFRIRLSEGTDKLTTAFTLDSGDFTVKNAVKKTQQNKSGKTELLEFVLECKKYPIAVTVIYSLDAADFFMRKKLTIQSEFDFVLERVDVEALGLEDAYQPYKRRDITADASGLWNPGLGQPLYGTKSGTFWGIEFPAADNCVVNGELIAGYLYGRKLAKGTIYSSYPAVLGVADDSEFVRAALFEYIEKTRKRPLRLQIQYNSYFDHGGVDRKSIARSVTTIHQELVVNRGCRPLSAYVIDDGWQNSGLDWSDKVWKVNTNKFDADFAGTRKLVKEFGSELGLWLSPGCLFGASNAIKKMEAKGFESIAPWMSMAGPKYMQALEDRMAELTQQGIGFFKLDGIFGHGNIRNFELHGSRYGLPEMPQLDIDDFTGNDKRLNDSKYDELKIYYLSAGTERLIQLFERLAKINPDIYLVISNGAWLSPWWLQHADAAWMTNAGDASRGSSRNEELVYRDERYYKFYTLQNAQFPLYAIFNHEPRKVNSDEPNDTFRKYLYMNFSRGTAFIEMYLKPRNIADADWDVLAEGLKWTYEMFPTFRNAQMHGGNPTKKEVYGYAAWNEKLGYISLHNPADKPQQYSVTLDRKFGLPLEKNNDNKNKNNTYYVNSPVDEDIRDLPKTVQFGDSLTFKLNPREIRIICFSKTPKNWTDIKTLKK